jgi:nitrous oxidase accessory protein NosD
MKNRPDWKTAAVVFVLVVALGCVLTASQSSTSPAIRIHEGESIQAAVDTAPEGAVLQLAAGQYTENITLDKGIAICGPVDGEARITGASPGAVVRIIGEGVEVSLSDLSICDARGFNGHGVSVEGSAAADLTRVTLTGNSWFGVYATDYARITLTDCDVMGNGTSGVSSRDFAQIQLEKCVVSDNTSHGLFALHLSQVTVRDTEIQNNWTGIWAWDATRVYLFNTSVTGNVDYGAMASDAALLVMEDSTIADNGYHGLLFERSSRGMLRRCRIVGNGVDGLFAQEDAILEINECEFSSNGRAGLSISGSSCEGGFDPTYYFGGEITGAGNVVPGPDQPNGNGQIALCPVPPGTWPQGFIAGE